VLAAQVAFSVEFPYVSGYLAPGCQNLSNGTTTMSNANSGLDPAFIEQQRSSLNRLRVVLLAAARNSEADEVSVNTESRGGPREPEDDAQKLSALELDGQLVAHDVMRLARVERALAKIEAGTYGLSDVSGLPIPRDRLEAVPEAICTLAEESAVGKNG
jgi:DnaK suppressor protein